MQVCGGDGLVLEPLAELWPPDLAGSLLLQHLCTNGNRLLPMGQRQLDLRSGSCA